MSLTTPDFTSIEPTLVVVPWYDAVVDPIGHDPRSHYVELFWLNVLGPTATWLLRRLVSGLDHYPDGYELDLNETARALGLGYTHGTVGPFTRALQRCVLFGAAQSLESGLAVRRRLPDVSQRHLERMPEHLRRAHRTWRRSRPGTDGLDQQRATALATAMLAVGDDPDVIERQLLGLGVTPPVAVDALRWVIGNPNERSAPEAA